MKETQRGEGRREKGQDDGHSRTKKGDRDTKERQHTKKITTLETDHYLCVSVSCAAKQ